jgi:hypothetical protein
MGDGNRQAGGTRDVTYDLISVAYHALKGAQTYGLYAVDADEAGDGELAQFFRDIATEDRQRADRAKQLLGKSLGTGGRG